MINNLLGKNSKSTIINEIRTDRNVILTDRNLIANKLNDYFVNIGPSLAIGVEENHTSAGVTNRGDLEYNTTFCFSDISVHQVLNNLKQLVTSKATGVDKIPAKVLKLSADIIAPSLTTIFNQSLHTGIFINDCKLAGVQTDL